MKIENETNKAKPLSPFLLFISFLSLFHSSTLCFPPAGRLLRTRYSYQCLSVCLSVISLMKLFFFFSQSLDLLFLSCCDFGLCLLFLSNCLVVCTTSLLVPTLIFISSCLCFFVSFFLCFFVSLFLCLFVSNIEGKRLNGIS